MTNQVSELNKIVYDILNKSTHDLGLKYFVYDTHDWCFNLTLRDLSTYCEKYFYNIIKAKTFKKEAVKNILVSLDLVDWYTIACKFYESMIPDADD